ncbi:2,5-diamino-6-(ribosylamino)-4(3H)-pyrimidinone 5'-phosphate reductase [Coniochaeta pulveracea]|uniref:2,5-diamino-6-ribosylamino-4(3H)-pyrimidinone 5'-phosphate reductase n=1 Tax=Coniochaeta pulveracea TaxID=177199 RepID=A0A420YHC3_9PEZI|nr:2,5-diamino-6-(ribosylamino)-4(3H)-pyrimidinone 5'-phosphate reductase [Coniochaeta pulveracea]
MAETLTFPPEEASKLSPYLPPQHNTSVSSSTAPTKPWVTLTYAVSLDSSLSLAPGVQTVLSGPQSKAMTHYLRSKHDAILVGVGTAVADDPGLNCRIAGAEDSQPRPTVLDPKARWEVREESKVIRLAREGKGKGPWVLVRKGAEVDEGRRRVLESVGGGYLVCGNGAEKGFGWEAVLEVLGTRGMRSVMVEGGGKVINSLLGRDKIGLVNSVIVTIAPTWLGKGGVVVSPDREEGKEQSAVGRLRDVKWCPLGDDVVLCGFPKTS